MALSKYQQAAQGFLPIRTAGGRSPAPRFEGDNRIVPVAAPTGPYVRVGPTPRSQLWGIAEALSEFESSLQPLIDKRAAEDREADEALAEKTFIENNEVGYAEGVRSGAIPAYASPAFTKAYKAAEGRRVARDVTSSILRNYETWDGKDADDPSNFSPWIATEVKRGLDGIEDPDVLRHAIPGVRDVTERLGSANAKYVGDRVMARAVEGVGKDIIGAIENASGEPVPGPDGTLITYSGLTDAINATIEQGRRIGIPEDKLNEVAADAVTSQAIAKRDYDLLKSLPESVAKTPYGAKAIAEAHDKIGTLQYRDETRADRLTKIQRKQATDAATRGVLEALGQDIDGEIPEDVLALGESGDPAFRVKAEDLRNKMRRNSSKVDPQREIDASVRIHTAEDPLAQAQIEIEAGNIGDPGRVNSILYTAQRLKQSKDRGSKSIVSSPATKQYEKAIKERFTSSNILNGRPEVDEAAYGSALVDYHVALTEWEDANPNASTVERMKAAREIGEEMLKAPPGAAPPKPTPQATVPAEPATAKPAEEEKPAEPAESDPLIDALRKSNPALKNVPDAIIRKYLPKAGGTPGKQGALDDEETADEDETDLALGGDDSEEDDEEEIDLETLTQGAVTPVMYDRKVRAAVRSNNPGAMWFASWQRKYGVLGRQNLNDGLGQGNNIALFPTKEAGAAAQFDLLNRRYSGLSLAAAVKRWSGGNGWQAYAAKLARTVGVPLNTPMHEILADRDKATVFARTAAAHEAGLRSYPMTPRQWAAGYDLFLMKNGVTASVPITKKQEG